MKVYCVFHSVDYEGSDLIGVYASSVKAEEEAEKLNKEHINVRNARWNTMSKSEQKMWGNYKRFIGSEYWAVEEYEVVE